MSGTGGRWRRVVRRIGWVAIVFILQIVLIVGFSEASKAPGRKRLPAPMVSILSSPSPELLALNDPTLFALPHYRGFSGPAWMRAPTMSVHAFEWSDQPRWFGPSTNDFSGGTPMTGHDLDLFELANTDLPPPPAPVVSLPAQFRAKSTLKLVGLARQLLTPPELPAWNSTNLLTNTVVRVMVDAKGITRSQTLLVRSGLADADEYALETSRNFGFTPTPAPLGTNAPMAGVTWGEAVFQWQNKPASEGGKK